MIDNGEDAGKSSSSGPASSSTKEEIRTVAHKIAANQVQISKAGVWGVLTAISEKARKRSQVHILLHGNEHILGRTVKEASCQFESQNVSGRHCKVYRKKVVLENTDQSDGMCYSVFLKDSSSNGTYLNWEKLTKDSPEAQIQHGDIISLINPPEHENAFAFVFREIRQKLSSHLQNSMPSTPAKRKASVADIFGEDIVGDGKRIKGLGIGGPEGPVSLDDVRRLQRSNEDLRQQLEAHVLSIEKLGNDARAAAAQHDIELKELQESVSASFLEQIKELQHELATKEKDVEEITALSTQRKSCIEDLNQRLSAASQSRTDAEEIIQSQKTTIAELEQQLEEERSQRRDEREKAEADLKAAVERVRLESLEELKRQSEAAARQHKEQTDVITKLQESDKENHVLMETLRSKLEDVRESLMKSEKKARQFEVQLREEETSSASARKKAAEKERELQRIKIELEKEKAAREDAWAKVSILELEMAAAIRDLGLEKQRLQGARERIVLRETQLRAFHATAEEIAALQQKQQEQLNGMLRTLEDGENCALPNIDEFETRTENLCGAVTRVREEIRAGNIGSDGIIGDGAASDEAETPKRDEETECASDSSSVEKCNTNKRKIGNALEDSENGDTQEDCADTIQNTPKNSRHDTEVMDTMLYQDDEQIGTEQVLATEAEATQLLESSGGGKRPECHVYATGSELARSRKTLRGRIPEDDEIQDCESDMGGDKMQVEDEEHVPMCLEGKEIAAENQRTTLNARIVAEPEKVPDMAKSSECPTTACHSIRNTVNQDGQAACPGNCQKVDEMASKVREDKNTITTNDLLTSEVPGSWAVSTPGSFHCDNESLRSDERKPGIGRANDEGLHQDFDASQIGASEYVRSRQDIQLNSLMRDQDMQPEITLTAGSQNYPGPSLGSRQSREHQALTEMIRIVDPDFRHRHGIRSSNGNAPDTEEDETEEEDDKNEDDDTQDDSGDKDSE